jgi:hypothetical protein
MSIPTTALQKEARVYKYMSLPQHVTSTVAICREAVAKGKSSDG